jgi:hypothetical protein
MPTSGRIGLAIVSGAIGLALCGCQNDEIQSYQVPKPEQSARTAKIDLRLLAARFQPGDRTWFIKLMGPAQAVQEHKEAFDRFVQSVHFTDQAGKPIAWTVPDGWREEGGSDMRYATFRMGTKDAPLEATVVSLGREAGSLLDNVNRWRAQIGLGRTTEAELGSMSTEMKIHGVAATLVDMTGQGAGTMPKRPPVASGRGPLPGAPPRDESEPALKYATPPGWKEVRPDRMSVAALQVADGDQLAKITVSPLGGPAGGLGANVNRWRGQIQLEPISEEDVRKQCKQLEIAGKPAQYIDLVGPENAGRDQKRILAVILTRGDETWFFKMIGPAGLVGKQKSAFEAFVGSVRFLEGKGARDG